MIFVMDACAMIAFLRMEAGTEAIIEIFGDEQNECFAHAINLCEVYYDFLRLSDEKTAKAAIADLKRAGVKPRNDMSQEFWQKVGGYKARIRKIALGDCFAIALANLLKGEVVTSDHKEFEPVANQGICRVKFFR